MAGRKQDDIWVHFERYTTEGVAGWKARCKLCKKEMQGVVNRLKQHYSSCSMQDHPIIAENESIDLVARSTALCGEVPDTSLFAKEKRPRITHIGEYVMKTSKSEAELLDLQIARYIYATNTPFIAVEHPEFMKLIKMLRPGYIPPNRHDIGNKLLNNVQGSLLDTCRKTLEDKTVSLSLDGWSNVHNEPVVCVSVTTDKGETFLTETIDTSGHSHTSEYLAELAADAITSCEINFRCHVRNVVTDNAANMAKMRRDLQKKIPNEILTYGCSAHLLNLLAQDVQITGVKEQVVQIVKYFRHTHLPAARYKQAGGNSLVIPHEIRWNTLTDCLKSYISNWHILVQVCEEYRDEINSNIGNKVKNYSIKRNAEDLFIRLKPISVALDRIQRENAIISDTVEVWKTLYEDLLSSQQPAHVLRKVDERAAQAISPAHYSANLIDPRYRGRKLTEKEATDAMEYIHQHCPNAMATVLQFKAGYDPFKSYMFSDDVVDNITPACWWASMHGTLGKDITKVAEQLLTAIASSAGIERIFSTFGYIHSKTRNRLGIEKAAKLVFVYRILNMKN
ncbi:Transposase [Oopsacas minuta]|uniref:Transposase n=1 Tax=Oopsacas minuta TaxID=111878 RepID=A0AAV7JM85_9METZ|nr:Transposase [Oopsacas minuta]